MSIAAVPAPTPMAVQIDPPAAVTDALAHLKSACLAWPGTPHPPPGADVWTAQAMTCQVVVGGWFPYSLEIFALGCLGSLVLLAAGWLLFNILRIIGMAVSAAFSALRFRRRAVVVSEGEVP